MMMRWMHLVSWVSAVIWGGIATGIFTQKSINPVARWDGLIFGDYHLFVAQIVGIISRSLWPLLEHLSVLLLSEYLHHYE